MFWPSCQWNVFKMSIESRLKNFPSRVKAIRTTLLGITRDEFAKRFNIPNPTLANWETGKVAITPASIGKLINELAKENIFVTEEWLINGRGGSPFGEAPIPDLNSNEESFFLLANPKAILFEIPDNSYEPLYYPGDLIGALLVDPAILPHMSLALVEGRKNRMYIKKLVVSDKGLVCFLPVVPSNLAKAIDYKPSMKVYKIIWFKSHSNQK